MYKSLLFFLILLRRLFQNRAIVIINVKTIATIINTLIHKLFIITNIIVIMVIITFTIDRNKFSLIIVLQLSHHFWIILFDCPVHNDSILLLSAFRCLDKYLL